MSASSTLIAGSSAAAARMAVRLPVPRGALEVAVWAAVDGNANACSHREGVIREQLASSSRIVSGTPERHRITGAGSGPTDIAVGRLAG